MTRTLILLLIVTASFYWYATVGRYCAVPLTYSIAPIDGRFNLKPESAASSIDAAITAWEAAAGRDLFSQAASGTTADIQIQFVFDERHERFLAEGSLRDSLDVKEHTSESLQLEYEKLVAEYDVKRERHQSLVATYEADLAVYNTEVASYNDIGGAPPEVFLRLEATKRSLDTHAKTIEAEGTALAALADSINDLGEKGNELIRQYNAGVKTYNDQFSETSEFTQGDYRDGIITIYTFTSENELTTVLAHELGHALDINHVEGNQSIMYYLMEDQPEPLTLSPADTAALVATCGETGTISTWIRTIINKYLR